VAAAGVFRRGAKKATAEQSENHNELSIDELRRYLTDEFIALVDKLIAGGIPPMIDWLADNVVGSKADVAQFPISIWRGRPEFAVKPPTTYVGTIHSFKGAEADTVVVFPDLARKWYQAWTGPPAFRDSVVRLFYVAVTRAKKRVVLCRPESGVYSVNLDKYA